MGAWAAGGWAGHWDGCGWSDCPPTVSWFVAPLAHSYLAGCRARTPEDIRRRQEALERERLNIFYPEAHRRGESVLGAIVIKNMCARARRQAALVQQEATAAAPRVQAEGGEGPAGTVLEAAED